MDNKSNLAYNLSAFEPKKSAISTPQIKALKSKKQEEKPTVMSMIIMVVACVVLAAMISMLLHTKAMLNEVGMEVSQLTSEYNGVMAENEKLKSDINEIMSIKEIESYARENLGMEKMEIYQIQYVNMNPSDEISVKPQENTALSQVLSKILP